MSRATKSGLLWTILLIPPLLVLIGAAAVSIWPRQIVGALNLVADFWSPAAPPLGRPRPPGIPRRDHSLPSPFSPAQTDLLLLLADGSPYEGSVSVDSAPADARPGPRFSRLRGKGPLIQIDEPRDPFWVLILTDDHAPTILKPPHKPADRTRSEPIPITLQKGFSHRIQVVDETGSPIPRARIRTALTIHDQPFHLNRDWYTDDTGWVTIPNVCDADYEFNVTVYDFQLADDTIFVHPEPEVDTTITLERRDLEGIAVDENDDPVADAVLMLVAEYHSTNHEDRDYIQRHGDRRVVLGVSDADGRFRLRHLHRSSIHLIDAQTPDGGYGHLSDVQIDAPSPKVTIHPKRIVQGVLELDPTATRHSLFFSYKLDFDIPNPRPGQWYAPMQGRELHYDEQGRFTFPVWPSTQGDLVTNNRPNVPISWPLPASPIVIPLPSLPEIPSEVSRQIHIFTAPEIPKPINGLMTLLPAVGPAGGGPPPLQVDLRNNRGEFTASTTQSFHYDSSAIPGYWTEPGTIPSYRNTPQNVGVRVHAKGSIGGRVVQADGTPAGEETQVFAFTDSNFMTSEYDLNPAPTPISLDSQGRFEIPFWPQNVDCRIQVKIGFVSMDAAPIRPDAREPHREVALELPKRRDVDVRVVDPEGRPIPDAPVTVVLDPQGIDKRWKAGRTDVDGRISLQGLADGPRDYRLEFDFEDDFVPMLIALNPGRSEAVVQARHGRTVQGQVVEAVTGLPISKVRLTALQAADDDPSVSTTTDADGRFRFTNLPAGVVKLVVDSNPATVIFVNGASSGEFSTDVDGPILVELLNLTRRFFEEQSE